MSSVTKTARQVFLEAIEAHAPDQWPAFLDQACEGDSQLRQRVGVLLEAHVQGGSLLDKPAVGSAATVGQPLLERPGTQIGPYKLLQQIGEGGFGAVFMAEQIEPVRRKVALKVIKPGMDTRQVIARFDAERQALAVMDHPNIARVLDAGATEFGRPYFVMELVRGIPITEYCDENNLPVRERLTLFASVCQAIQHAHTKGIIHRDIKPTNVLVTRQDGQPMVKVIDFGVAKAMGQQLTDKTLFTDVAQMIGTPLYMSPEQAKLSSTDIDTRSDIYSLGVLLYELLTGSTPVSKEQLKQAAFDEIRRIIREDEPQKPSTRISTAEAAPSIAAQRHTEPATLTKLVRGELDWIVMKALEKDRSRRYETANGLARDIERHLNDEPVQACPPSTWYRFRKFARRNKGPVLAAALVVMALVAGIIGTTWGMIRATVAEADAVTQAGQKEEQRAKAVREGERATQAEAVARKRLFQAKLAESKASRRSRELGQRFETWKVVKEAANLARELKLKDEDFENLRREAIGCLALADVRFKKEWLGFPPGSQGAPFFDANLDHYARTDSKGIISVRRVDDDHQLKELPGNEGGAAFMAFSPNGNLLAVRYWHSIPAQSTNFQLWDWQQGKVVFQPSFPVDSFNAVAFTPDGRILALGQNDGTISLCELANGKASNPMNVGRRPTRLAFSPDGDRLAICLGAKVQVREFPSGKLVHAISHPASVNWVAWSRGGNLLGVGCNDANAYVWDTTMAQQRILRGHLEAVVHLDFAPSGDTLVSGAWDGTSRLWNPWSGRELIRFPGTAVQLSRDGRRVVSQSGSSVSLWEVEESREFRTLPPSQILGYEGIVYGDFTPDGRWLAVGTNNGIQLWDMAMGTKGALLPVSSYMKNVKFHPKGKRMFTGGVGGLFDWPVHAREGVLQLGPARRLSISSFMQQISLDREGRILTAAGESTGWVLDTADPAGNVRQVSHRLANFATTSPNGKWMATGTWNGNGVKVWNTATGKELVCLIPEARIARVAFSPDGRWLVTGADNVFSMWRTPQGDQPADNAASWPLQREIPTDHEMGGGVFSTDGKLLAVMLSAAVVRLLDPATGHTIAELGAPNTDLYFPLCFSPDNTQLVMGTKAGTVHVWDLRLIRERLKEIGLDWDLPDYPPALLPGTVKSIRVEVDLGDLNPEFVSQKDIAAALLGQNKPAEAIACFRKAIELNPGSVETNNALAWLLATCADDKLRDPKEAVKVATNAVKLAPQQGYYWNTLGVAHYRAGNWKDCIDALRKSDELFKGEMCSFNAFFLAMAHSKLGEKEQAHEWYERGVKWMEKNQPNDEEQRRFKTEAADLLGVKEKKDQR